MSRPAPRRAGRKAMFIYWIWRRKKETGERPGRKTRWGCSVPGLTRLASGPSATCLPRAICAEAAPDARARVSPSPDQAMIMPDYNGPSNAVLLPFPMLAMTSLV